MQVDQNTGAKQDNHINQIERVPLESTDRSPILLGQGRNIKEFDSSIITKISKRVRSIVYKIKKAFQKVKNTLTWIK